MEANRLADLRKCANQVLVVGLDAETVVELLDHIEQQQAELKEWNDTALIVCDVCDGSGFDKPGTGYDSTCDCAGGYTGRYTAQQMADKLFQQQAEIERLNRAYEVLERKLKAISPAAHKAATEEAQRIKEGDGEQG
jgi:hypothetical protein